MQRLNLKNKSQEKKLMILYNRRLLNREQAFFIRALMQNYRFISVTRVSLVLWAFLLMTSPRNKNNSAKSRHSLSGRTDISNYRVDSLLKKYYYYYSMGQINKIFSSKLKDMYLYVKILIKYNLSFVFNIFPNVF